MLKLLKIFWSAQKHEEVDTNMKEWKSASSKKAQEMLLLSCFLHSLLASSQVCRTSTPTRVFGSHSPSCLALLCLLSLHSTFYFIFLWNMCDRHSLRAPLCFDFRLYFAWTHRSGGIYDRREVMRSSLWGGIERSTGLRVFFLSSSSPPCFRFRGEGEGGIWLLPPHPQLVWGGFRKKRFPTWNAEMRINGEKKWPRRCRCYFLFSFSVEMSLKSVCYRWGEEHKPSGE